MKLAITLGDPGGIGPEIVFHYLKNQINTIKKLKIKPILFGSRVLLEQPYLKQFINPRKIHIITSKDLDQIAEYADNAEILFVDCFDLKPDFTIAKPDAVNGLASFQYLETALASIKKGLAAALVTAPICKESFQVAGLKYHDHTSYLQEKTESANVSMGFWTENLKTVLVTIHKSLREVPDLINEAALTAAIENTFFFAKLLKIENPRIAISGLNPHAGENGLFGSEENEIIIPTIKKLGFDLVGPLPPDTVYFRAAQGEFDLVISLYHDQALIPIKLLAFDSAVNISLGLPFIRTSPDHGTAFDRAYTKESSFRSLQNAVELAVRCAQC